MRDILWIMKTKNKISKEIENKISMYKVVLLVCLKKINLIQLFAGINNAYLTFKAKVEEVDSLMEQKLLIITGLSTNKKKMKILLSKLAGQIAGAVRSYAYSQNDYELLEKMGYKDYQIGKMRDTDVVKVCMIIYNEAMTNAGNIVIWGVDGNMLQTLITAINLFADKSPQPTEAIEHRATLTRMINERIRVIDDYKKNQLDNGIKMLESTDATFVSDYKNSSKIIDAGMRHMKAVVITPEEVGYITLNIVDKDGNPVEGVTTTMTNGDKVLTDETDEDGDGYHEKVTVGKWTLTIEMFGYKKITVEDLEFTGNDEFEMDFVLEDEEIVPPVES